MHDSYTIRPPRDDAELQRLLELFQLVFNHPAERGQRFAERLGIENFRLVFCGQELAGGLGLIPMGQFFGGRSVPSAGVTVVGIAPHFRGRGAGTAIMRDAMRELHERRCPLSALYPATQPVYRSVGFEQAGSWWEITLPLKNIDINDHELDIRPIDEADAETIQSLYRADAAQHNGTLDRGDMLWWRVRETKDGPTHGQLVHDNGRIEGYIHYAHRANEGHPPYHIAITDIVARTPRAGRRLLTFLAEHRSIADRAVFFRSPADPLLVLMPEQSCRIQLELQWMLRIVDVPLALEARGYAEQINAELHLNVRDDLIEANNGPFVMTVRDGRASVQRGGDGRLEIDIRGLASLYAGHRTANALLTCGLLRADRTEAEAATAVFAGPDPWMVEIF